MYSNIIFLNLRRKRSIRMIVKALRHLKTFRWLRWNLTRSGHLHHILRHLLATTNGQCCFFTILAGSGCGHLQRPDVQFLWFPWPGLPFVSNVRDNFPLRVLRQIRFKARHNFGRRLIQVGCCNRFKICSHPEAFLGLRIRWMIVRRHWDHRILPAVQLGHCTRCAALHVLDLDVLSHLSMPSRPTASKHSVGSCETSIRRRIEYPPHERT